MSNNNQTINPEYWNGIPGPVPGNTAFGYFDNDPLFLNDAPKVAQYAAFNLGYPIMEIELQDKHFYTAFEDAICHYSFMVNTFNIQNNLLEIQGSSIEHDLTQREISPSMHRIITISKQYGSEIGVGGNVNWYSGSFDTMENLQTYEVGDIFGNEADNIEIKRVFHYGKTTTGYYDPYIGSNVRYVLQQFGAVNNTMQSYVMSPLYQDLMVMQQSEMNRTIRLSSYGFNIINTKIQLFPVPQYPFTVWFEYIKKSERSNPLKTGIDKVSDYSNANYQIIQYRNINQPGKQWIKEYAAARTREILGTIRSKYRDIPYGDDSISLDGDTMRSEAENEKRKLDDQLTEILRSMSKEELYRSKSTESETIKQLLNNSPLMIYCG